MFRHPYYRDCRTGILSPDQIMLLKTIYAAPEAYLIFMRRTLVWRQRSSTSAHVLSIISLCTRWPARLEDRRGHGRSRPVAEGGFKYEAATGTGSGGEVQPLELLIGLQHQKKSTALIDQPVPIRLGMQSLRTGLIVTGTTGTGSMERYSYTRQFLHTTG